MMRLILALVALTLIPALSFAEIFSKSYADSDDAEVKALIVDTVQSALSAKQDNRLKQKVRRLKRQFKNDELGTVGEVSQDTMFLLSSGKGSASSYGGTYLVGVPVSMNGTGLIEEYALYFKVNYAVEMGEKITITVENMVDLKDAK